MRTLTLSEYERRSVPGLSDEQATDLNGCDGISVGLGDTPSEHLVTASGWVGVTGTTETQVIVKPKVSVTRLLEMLVAAGASPWLDEAVDLAENQDPIDALAGVFISSVEKALLAGVLQGYKSVEDSTTVLRGRLRMGAQIARHRGQVQPLEVVYDDFTEDIPENQIIAAATRKLLRLHSLSSEHRRRLLRIEKRLMGITPWAAGGRIPEVVFTRLNLRYQMPIKIATLILDNDAVLFDVGTRVATTFLVNMYQLFEDFVGQVLQRSSPPDTMVSLQHPATLDIYGRINMKPDVVWMRGGRPIAVADLKYKSIDNKTLPNADVYQALAYATALGLDRAHLIYAKGNETPVQHDILHNGITIVVHAVDLDVTLQQLTDTVESLGQSIATRRLTVDIAI